MPMKVTLKECEKAIIASCGILQTAADNLGVSRQALHKRVQNNKRLQKACEDAREVFIDKAESALKKAVDNEEAWAVSLSLKTLGKKRGFVEKQEIDATGDITINVVKFGHQLKHTK
jgi:hypothetical protein